jgi:hypothetical protein
MEYVEILRARRVLFWFGLSSLGCLALTLMGMYWSHAHANAGDSSFGSENLSSLVGIAVFGGIIVATALAGNLNAEHTTTAIIWTRPRSREAIAWGYVAVDLAAILAGYAIVLAAIVVGVVASGLLPHFHVDAARSLTQFALGMGGAAMWYGLVSVAAARLEGHGARVAALSWAVFLIGGGVIAAPVPDLLHYVIVALNYLNPLAWLGDLSSSGVHAGGGIHSVLHLDPWARALGAWAIALVAIVASTKLWSTREA